MQLTLFLLISLFLSPVPEAIAFDAGDCAEDIERLCPGLVSEKDIFTCMRANNAKISAACKAQARARRQGDKGTRIEVPEDAGESAFDDTRDPDSKFLIASVEEFRKVCRDLNSGYLGVPRQKIYMQLRRRMRGDLSRPASFARPASSGDAKRKADKFLQLVTGHAILYIGTRDRTHFVRVREILSQVLSWDSWSNIYPNPQHNGLDRDAITIGASLAYDWLKEELSAAERNNLAAAIESKGLEPIFTAMGADGDRSYFPFSKPPANRNHWANGAAALGIGSLALSGDNSTGRYLAAARAAAERFVAESGGRDGGYPESAGYGEFALWYLQIFRDMYLDASGEDIFGRDSKGWIAGFHEYLIHATLPNGLRFVPFNDEGGNSNGCARFAMCAGSEFPEKTKQLCQGQLRRIVSRAKKGCRMPPLAMVYVDPGQRASNVENLSRFKVFREIGHAFYRSDWSDPAASFIAMKAESHTRRFFPVGGDHPQFDGGQVVFYANGAAYLGDAGYQWAPGFEVSPRHDRKRNRFSRTNLGHNNVIFNGKVQNTMRSRIGAYSGESDMFAVRMDLKASYPKSAGLKEYSRYVVMAEATFAIIDVFDLVAEGEVETRWILSEMARRKIRSAIAVVSGGRFSIRPAGAAPLYACSAATTTTPDVEVKEINGRGGVFRFVSAKARARAGRQVSATVFSFNPGGCGLSAVEGGFKIMTDADPRWRAVIYPKTSSISVSHGDSRVRIP